MPHLDWLLYAVRIQVALMMLNLVACTLLRVVLYRCVDRAGSILGACWLSVFYFLVVVLFMIPSVAMATLQGGKKK